MSQQLEYRTRVEIGTNSTGITMLRLPSYQAFEGAGFDQGLLRNAIKGTMCTHVFQYTNTLKFGAFYMGDV